jgi:hypothetical protein
VGGGKAEEGEEGCELHYGLLKEGYGICSMIYREYN